MFARLGSFAYRRKGTVVIGWFLGLILLGALSGAVGSAFSTSFGLPSGVESKRGIDLLDQHFGGRGGGQNGSIVFETTGSLAVTDPSVEAPVTEFLDQVAKLDHVASVGSPYAEGSGVHWPGSDAALPVLLAVYTAASFALVATLRRQAVAA